MQARDGCGLLVLDRGACLALLAVPWVGTLAVTENALPVVLPVGYVLDGDRVIMRVAAGSLLARAAPGHVVAFCAHSGDRKRSGSWSVAVTGTFERVSAPGDPRHYPYGPVAGWSGDDADDIWFGLPTELMTGRREPTPRRSLTATARAR